jgi:hypothetical protein
MNVPDALLDSVYCNLSGKRLTKEPLFGRGSRGLQIIGKELAGGWFTEDEGRCQRLYLRRRTERTVGLDFVQAISAFCALVFGPTPATAMSLVWHSRKDILSNGLCTFNPMVIAPTRLAQSLSACSEKQPDNEAENCAHDYDGTSQRSMVFK